MGLVYLGMWTCVVLLVSHVVAQSHGGRRPQTSYRPAGRHGHNLPEQCPLACRCSQIRPGHELLRRWQGPKSSADIRMLENAIEQGHRFRRDFSSGTRRSSSGRDMMCMGLQDLPSAIPSDIIRLSIFGEDMVSNQSSDHISYDQSQRPSSIIARQTIFQTTNQLSTIRKSAFIGSRDLLELSIVGNNVRYISPAEFEYLPNLVMLNLKKNNLKSLEAETFQGLHQLEDLRLSQNDLHILPPGLLDNVPKLKKLYLDGNQIRTLHIDTFHSLRNLEILDLSSNNLTYLSRTMFVKNRNLRELYLDDNMLDGIRADWFSHALQLQKLSLNRNRITRLDPGSLTVVRMLSELALSGNQISRIHARTLSAFQNLRILDLSQNRIRTIPKGTFQRTSKLTNLNLSGNRLTLIHADVFGMSSALKILDLSDNILDTLTKENFQNLNKLEKMDLSGNTIKDIVNGTFLGLRKLRELNLSKNKIRAIADTSFAVSLSRYISQVTWLNLQHNQISVISGKSFRSVPHLKFLNVAFNKIHSLQSQAFESQKQLNTLLLNNNLIPRLPDGIFSALKSVRHLNIGYNQLTDLPGSVLKGLSSLDQLNAQGNRIKSLKRESFQEIPTLARANFSENMLRYVDLNNLFPSSILNNLDLSGNNLSDLQVSKSFGLRLKHLSLANNHLTTLHSDISNSMATGGELALAGNPWYCDCHLSWLQYLVPIWQLRLVNDDQLVCGQPRELSRKRILSLRQSEFTCGTSSIDRGSPALRPPVREKHNYPRTEHTATQRPKHPQRRQKYHQPTTTPRNVLYPIVPNHKENRRHNNRNSNILPEVSQTLFPSKVQGTKNTRVNPSLNGKFRQQKRNNGVSPIKPSKRRGGWKTPEPKISTTPKPKPRYQWWRNNTAGVIRRTSSPKPREYPYYRGETFTRAMGRSMPARRLWTPRPTTIQIAKETPKPRTQASQTKTDMSGNRWWNPVSPYYTSTSRPTTTDIPHTRQRSKNRPFFTTERPNRARNPRPSFTTERPNRARNPRPSFTTERPNRARNPFHPVKPTRPILYKPRTKPPLRDTTRRHARNFRPQESHTLIPTTYPYNRAEQRRTPIPQSNKSFTNRSYHRPVPTTKPFHSRRRTTRRPYVLTLPSSLKPKATFRPYYPRSFLNRTSPLTTASPDKMATRKRPTEKMDKHVDAVRRSSLPLGCPLRSDWRLHFDKALIRRHKAQVKNYHVTVMNSRRRPVCNAVLLSDWWILTTASCVEKNLANPSKLRDPAWSPNYHIKIGVRELNKVTAVVVHPAYLSRRSEEHDFALFKLKYESLMTKVFTPPCIMPPEWFRGRSAWVVPGVVSARFDKKKKPRSNLQTLAVKVWETDCEENPASCLRIRDQQLNSKSAFTDGAPLYLGYSKSRWSLVGLGRSSNDVSVASKYLPVWTVLDWLKSVVEG